MKNISLLALLVSLACAGPAMAAGDAAAGQAKSAPCAGCHGADGNSVNAEWPKLAGQHPGYLEKQLADFKKGEQRNNAMMAPMVASLSEQDMADISAFFASQAVTPGYASAETLERGRRLYLGGDSEEGIAACVSCHGPNGTGNALAGFPVVAGQHAAYTIGQLKAFRSGQRANDAQGMMRDVVRRMSDADMKAVAEFMAGLN